MLLWYFKPGPIYVVKRVGGNNFDIREEIGRVEGGINDPCIHLSAGNTNLMNQFAICRDLGMIRFTA